MNELPHDFLRDLAVVLGVAAVTTVLSQLVRLPVVLGYLLAGVIVGPETPVPLFADRERIRELSELGVIFLMFSIGLEFSLRQLSRVAPVAGLVALVEIGLTFLLGSQVVALMGGDGLTSIVGGAVACISSTMIVLHTFRDVKAAPAVRELVVGVLVMEDVAALLLLALLTAVASGGEAPTLALAARTGGRMLLFFVGVTAVGLVLLPPVFRRVVALHRRETLLVASVGLCFALALLARAEGFSVALGAFLAGALLAEAGLGRRVEPLVEPLRDIFSGIFFVAIGMLLDPRAALDAWPAVLALVAAVVLGKSVGVTTGAFLSGQTVRTSVQAGMSLTQIGEFSFVLAATVPAATLAGGARLFNVVVAAAVLTATLSPLLIRVSERVALIADARLPRPLQTFVTLYGSWLDLVRRRRAATGEHTFERRALAALLLDALLLVAIVIGAAVNVEPLAVWVGVLSGVDPPTARLLVIAGAFAVALPFAIGMVRVARRLGRRIAERAMPTPPGRAVDQARSPRRVLAASVELSVMGVLGLLLLAVTQPLLQGLGGPVLFLLLLAFLGVAFWRSAADLEGHVRAGAEVALHVLKKDADKPAARLADLHTVEQLLPGIGALAPVTIEPGSRAAGRTLAELNLRGLTGATIVAVHRAGKQRAYPDGHERLEPGDVVAVSGSEQAVAAAVAMLEHRSDDT
jgi:CPA2 family monovalent cation:H+ antiporter-2